MKRRLNIAAIGLAAALSAGAITGCGGMEAGTGAENAEETVTGEETSKEVPTGEKPDDMPEGEGGEGMPDGEPPEGEEGERPEGGPGGEGGNAPGEGGERPEGMPDGEPPEGEEGERPEGGPGGEGGSGSPMGGFGGGQGGTGGGEASNGTAVTTLDADASITGETYTSDGDDENALRIDGAKVTLDSITISKSSGNSSNEDSGNFYGLNAGLLALNGAEVTITGSSVTTGASTGNGVFSYGEGTVINISDTVIRTSGDNSGGIQTTGGGTTNAANLDIETSGRSSAAIRSDRGGGTVKVEGGSYVTNGTGSPAVYSTADISVSDAVLTANASEAVVIEGKNSVELTDCTVTGNMQGTYNDDSENIHNIMIYQSMSGDAEEGQSSFTATGGSIKALAGDFIYVTNTDCIINLTGVDLELANDVLLRVEGNSSARGWGRQGENGGDAILNASGQVLAGAIKVDDISSLELNLTDGSEFTGSINSDDEGGTVKLSLSGGSTWTLDADSYITSFEGDTSGVNANGHHLYVNGVQML